VLVDQAAQLGVVEGGEIGQNVHAGFQSAWVANSVPVPEVFLKF
jgi:hypothetical protein